MKSLREMQDAGLQQHVHEWARAWVTGGNIERGELKSLREMQDRSRGYVSEERRVEATVLHTAWRASMNVREVEVEMTVCHGHTCGPPHSFRATEAL